MTNDGKFIKAAREHLGLGTTEFAEALGVKRHTIWRFERDDPVPKTTRLAIEKLLIDYERKLDEERQARVRKRAQAVARAKRKRKKDKTS
jgi:DNA-binding XRE family transcriptional regulator